MHTAHCQCGQLRVEADDRPDYVTACNCRACQRRTGAAFGVGAYFRKDELRIDGDRRTTPAAADRSRPSSWCSSPVFTSTALHSRRAPVGLRSGAANRGHHVGRSGTIRVPDAPGRSSHGERTQRRSATAAPGSACPLRPRPCRARVAGFLHRFDRRLARGRPMRRRRGGTSDRDAGRRRAHPID